MIDHRIVVLGESLVDVIDRDGTLSEVPGGSPFNVARGLARLGVANELATSLGCDPHGDLLREHLHADAVNVANLARADAVTSVAHATLGRDNSATYRFEFTWNIDEPEASVRDIRHVHVGSLGAVVLPGADTVHAWAQRARHTATVSFDPNCRILPGISLAHMRTASERFVAISDIVKASEEDLALLYPDLDPSEAARRWSRNGPALMVMTRGGSGSTAYRAGAEIGSAAAQRLTVADTVGAGDSFMAALLASLVEDDALGRENLASLRRVSCEPILRFATAAAAITCSRAGADLPAGDEVRDLLARGV